VDLSQPCLRRRLEKQRGQKGPGVLDPAAVLAQMQQFMLQVQQLTGHQGTSGACPTFGGSLAKERVLWTHIARSGRGPSSHHPRSQTVLQTSESAVAEVEEVDSISDHSIKPDGDDTILRDTPLAGSAQSSVMHPSSPCIVISDTSVAQSPVGGVVGAGDHSQQRSHPRVIVVDSSAESTLVAHVRATHQADQDLDQALQLG
jgi:hypothetical protein